MDDRDTGTRLLTLLGRPRLKAEGSTEIVLPGNGYLLCAMLAAVADHRLDRETLRRMLWQTGDAGKRAASLRQLLSRIDRAIPDGQPALLISTAASVALNLESWRVDLIDLLRAETLAASEWRLLEGDLLEGVASATAGAEDWLTIERQRIADKRIDIIGRRLAEPETISERDGEFLARLMLTLDPSSELAYRTQMLNSMKSGNRAGAASAYERGRKVLREDFAAELTPETTELAQSLGLTMQRAAAVPASPRLPEPGVRPERSGVPRVVIMPPENVFSDPLTERLGRALLEDVTIGLSQRRGFKIIAAHTSLELSRRSIDPANAHGGVFGEGFDYSVVVSLRGSDDAFHAKCRLTRLADSNVLWGMELPLATSRLQESFAQLARRIVMSVSDHVERTELSMPVNETDPTAYRLYLEGNRYLDKTDLRLLRQARKWFKASLHLYDGFAPAHAGMARSLSLEYLVRLMKDTELLDQANEAALAARQHDPSNGRAHRELGYIALYRRRHAQSLEYYQQAQELNPHDADILADYADALSHDGQQDSALAMLQKALTLNPLPSDHYYWYLGGIYFVMGDYEKALEALEQIKSNPAVARLLAATHAMRGDLEKARKFAAIVVENFPDFRTEHLWHFMPDKRASDTQALISGLQRAGLS